MHNTIRVVVVVVFTVVVVYKARRLGIQLFSVERVVVTIYLCAFFPVHKIRPRVHSNGNQFTLKAKER